ncbi:MAG: hypothetical protein AAFX09_05915 [Pseudomonadota bacterium]
MQPAHGALLIGVLVAALAAPPAFSEQSALQGSSDLLADAPSLGPFSIQIQADADVLLALGDGEAREDAPYADISVRIEAEAINQDGLRYGARLSPRIQRDNGRRGLARAVAGAPTQPGLLSGLSRGEFDPASVRGGVETAELFIKTGWGEAVLGVGDGAARLEAAELPGAFRLMRADGALADSTGLMLVDTAHGLSGRAAKLTVRSRRLIGFRASASFTPQADLCGVDACAAGSGLAERVAELALSFDRRLRSTGARWAASVAMSAGEASPRFDPATDALDDPVVLSVRLVRERNGVSAGLGWLRSNDGLAEGRYEALSAALAYERGDWLYAFEAARGEAEPSGLDGWSIQLGASRLLAGGALIGIGVVHAEEAARGASSRSTTQLFLETGLRF